jgi:hypothetical protein
MITRRASCSCGQLALTCTGEPQTVGVCHCRRCQLRSGGPYGAAAFFPEDAVEIEGGAAVWERRGDSGGRVAFRFCTTCGSTVWWTRSLRPGVIAVAVGAFADPDFPAPVVEVHTDTALPWARLASPPAG